MTISNILKMLVFTALIFGINSAQAGNNVPVNNIARNPIYTPSNAFKTGVISTVVQTNFETLRNRWCQILTDAEHEEACPNPLVGGPEFSDEYIALCGEVTTSVCRQALGFSTERCPGFVYRPGGC